MSATSNLGKKRQRVWAKTALVIFMFANAATTAVVLARPAMISVYGASQGTSVTCTPSPVTFGSSSSCTAKVTGKSPTGTVVWTSGGAGDFSKASCSLSSGSCQTKYTPLIVSLPVTITATYQGDKNNPGSSGNFSLGVVKVRTLTTVACHPASVRVGGIEACTATVTGVNQTGTINWVSNGNGTFQQSPTCSLTLGACTVTYFPTSGTYPSTTMMTASYGGDVNNGNSSGSTSFQVTLSPTTTSVSCSPSTIFEETSSLCLASVSGYGPVGYVTFTSSKSIGIFGGECELSFGNCSVTFTGTAPGTTNVVASYEGDSNNAPSRNSSVSITVLSKVEYVLNPGDQVSSLSSCANINGSWEANSTCAIGNIATLGSNDYVLVLPGATLAITGTVSILGTVNDTGGTISNSGVINILKGGAILNSRHYSECGSVRNTQSITNLGTISNFCNFLNVDSFMNYKGALVDALGGVFSSKGTFTNSPGGLVRVDNSQTGTFTNSGTFNNLGILDFNGGDAVSAFETAIGTLGLSGSFSSTNALNMYPGSTIQIGQGRIEVTHGTVSVPSGVTLSVGDGCALQIDSGAKLDNEGQITAQSGGVVTNGGAFSNEVGSTITNGVNGDIVNNLGGTMTNGGTLTNSGTVTTSGLLVNSGTLSNGVANGLAVRATITDKGNLTNIGTFVIYSGTITVNAKSTITNGGHITVFGGTMTSGGAIDNEPSGTITIVSGSLDDTPGGIIINGLGGTISNGASGSVNNIVGGLISNVGTFNNQGTITTNGVLTNNGTFNVLRGASVTNSGPIENYGTITNDGTVDITSNGGIVNYGAVSNNREITNTNDGAITNDGVIINNLGGIVSNQGQLVNDGTLDVCGGNPGDWSGSGYQNPCSTAEMEETSVTSGTTATQTFHATGMSVSITGTSGTTVVIAAAQDLNQPSWTPEVNLNPAYRFYDLEVLGVSGGASEVCIFSSAVDSKTVIEFYASSTWTLASAIVDNLGNEVCGIAPVSAFNGSPLVIGDSSGSTGTTTSTTTSSGVPPTTSTTTTTTKHPTTSTSTSTSTVASTTSTTTTTSSSSSTSSTNPSTTVSISSSASTTTTTSSETSSGSSGIPEFPYQFGVVAAFTVSIVASYVLARQLWHPRRTSNPH